MIDASLLLPLHLPTHSPSRLSRSALSPMEKRKDPPAPDAPACKRTRPTRVLPMTRRRLRISQTMSATLAKQSTQVPLRGQRGEVYSCKFSPSGNHAASAGSERSIYLWNTRGDCSSYGIIKGHIGPIQELHWSGDGSAIFTASSDTTCGVFDSQTGVRSRILRGHTHVVNCCSPDKTVPSLLVSGSNDGCTKLWDIRSRDAVATFESWQQVNSTAIAQGGTLLYTAGSQKTISVWDTRTRSVLYSLSGHRSAISGIRLSPDDIRLLSYASDNTLRIWDLRPMATTEGRLLCTFVRGQDNQENEFQTSRPSWSKDGMLVAVGGTEGKIALWDTITGNLFPEVLGHHGHVHEVDFHPSEAIVASCGSDRNVLLSRFL